MPEPEQNCVNCMLFGDGWQIGNYSLCFADGEYHEVDDRCDFFEPRRDEMETGGLRMCEKFKGMPTNTEVCVHWMRPAPDFKGDKTPAAQFVGHCREDLECLTEGQRPSRPYEAMDTEEDSFE